MSSLVGVTVGFEVLEYEVSTEGDPLQVCLTLDRKLEKPISVVVTSTEVMLFGKSS